ncbi:MAG: hypothetical protein K6D02_01955 [Lachnospiraceae bacterium]|nr:hypothetical protein [Lachnospiraceae bacterium]
MKKGIYAFLAMMLTIIVVTASIGFIYVNSPKYTKTDGLIKKVAKMLKLDLRTSEDSYNSEDLVNVEVKYKKKKKILLKTEGKMSVHFITYKGYTLTLNSKVEDYKKLSKKITDNNTAINEIINENAKQFSYKTASEIQLINGSIDDINEMLESDIVIGLEITDYTLK